MTQAQLKEILHYNPDTGIFTRKKISNNKQKIGDVVGTTTHHSGYVSIRVNHKHFSAHRLAWLYEYGILPTLEIDHINRIRNDNRVVNLREITKLENMKNIGIRKDNKSGHKGVKIYHGRCRDYWCAELKVNKKFVLKKYFRDKQDAIIARKQAEKEYNIL